MLYCTLRLRYWLAIRVPIYYRERNIWYKGKKKGGKGGEVWTKKYTVGSRPR